MTTPYEEEQVIAHAAAHWFTQGGKAQFGDIGTPQNADELIAEILTRVRATYDSVAQEVRDLRANAASAETYRRAAQLNHEAWHTEQRARLAAEVHLEAQRAALRESMTLLHAFRNAHHRCLVEHVAEYREPYDVRCALCRQVDALSVRLTRHQTEENDEKDHTRVDGHS